MRSPFRGTRLAWTAVLFLILAVGAWLLWQPSSPPPFVVLGELYAKPIPVRDRVLNSIPGAGTSRLGNQVGDLLFGKRKPLNMTGVLFTFPGPPSALALGEPTFSVSNECQAWLIPNPKGKPLFLDLQGTNGLVLLHRAGMGTADGVASTLSMTHRVDGVDVPVGATWTCFGRVQTDATDLFTEFTLSEAVTNVLPSPSSAAAQLVTVRTNADLAVRVQIPKNKSLLLIPAPSDHHDLGTIGMIIELR